MKKLLSQNSCVRAGYRIYSSLRDQYCYSIFSFGKAFFAFINDYRRYKLQKENPNFQLSAKYIYPCLKDKTLYTPIEPTYFFQDTWGAGKIFQIMPGHHYDVGSSIMTVGIISQIVPVTIIDIRPVDLSLKNLHFQQGSILNLPFADKSIESLSSLCVVEHIGLGRYGDPVDPWGSEKAVAELKRVLMPGGNLLFSVPVDSECRIYFNAHRAFTREYLMKLFRNMELIEERYVYGREIQDFYESSKGFGTGLFHFRKEQL